MDAAGERMLQQFFSTFRCRIVDKDVESAVSFFRRQEAAVKEMSHREKRGRKNFFELRGTIRP